MPLLCTSLGSPQPQYCLGFCCWHWLWKDRLISLWLILPGVLNWNKMIFTQLFKWLIGSLYLHQEPVEPETLEGVWWANGWVHAGHPVPHPPRRTCYSRKTEQREGGVSRRRGYRTRGRWLPPGTSSQPATTTTGGVLTSHSRAKTLHRRVYCSWGF